MAVKKIVATKRANVIDALLLAAIAVMMIAGIVFMMATLFDWTGNIKTVLDAEKNQQFEK
jgi:ABC-type uncharacterized transport system permease subunit